MTFTLSRMFWLDSVFLWTNRNSFSINVQNCALFKSFNKTIGDFWYQLTRYLPTQEVIITSAIGLGNYNFFWVDKPLCQPYQKTLIV
jgi:hypothetical protein